MGVSRVGNLNSADIGLEPGSGVVWCGEVDVDVDVDVAGKQ